MFGPCFVLLYLVSFLVLQSYLYGRERWLLYFNCLPGALYSVFFCHGAVGWSAVCDYGIS